MSYGNALSRLGPVVARKRGERSARSLDAIASGDRLFVNPARLMVAHECYTVPTLDYLTRKRKALRADAFRLRYGRDYWTGRPRHARRNATAEALS